MGLAPPDRGGHPPRHPRTAGVRGRTGPRSAAGLVVTLAAACGPAAFAQLLPDPPAGTEAGSATVYTEQGIGDVDPLGVSTRWMDPAHEADLNRDRVVRARPLTPAEAARAQLDPLAGSSRGYAYRRPGVRATFHRPAYVTWTAEGPRVNGAPAWEGAFREIIPPDTVFVLTPPIVPPAELTAFSAGMRVDRRLGLERPTPPVLGPVHTPVDPAPADAEPAVGTAEPTPARRLQPWVRLRTDTAGRVTLDER